MSYGDVGPRSTSPNRSTQEVQFECSNNLPRILEHFGLSVLVSTYQAGKVVVIDGVDERVSLEFHSFDRPMGVAVDEALSRLAVATRDSIWIANNESLIARQLPEPAGSCFLGRRSYSTGDIAAHEIAWAENSLWIVNTRFSCLCTTDERNSFIPRWRPHFIDQLVPEDRCHLNGVAVANGRPQFVTAFAQSNSREAWRANRHETGCLINVDANVVVGEGFAMPHSPRIANGGVYLLNSGHGSLVRVNANGAQEVIGQFPGFTRGLAIYGELAFVGLSKVRENATFGELPISNQGTVLKCGFAIMNLTTGEIVALFEFKTGITEIFEVSLVAHPGKTVIQGPNARIEGRAEVWVLPGSESQDG